MAGPTHLAVGLLKKPHGVKGDALVFPLTDEPEAVFRTGRTLAVLDRGGQPTGQEVIVTRSRAYHRAWLVHFEGMEDRTALEVLRERYLGLAVGEARPLEPGEFYLHELVGLRVETKEGEAVGDVTAVVEAPQGWLLNVKGASREHLIPFTAGVVRRVDRAEKLVVVTPPAGLLEI
ncbi:MAG: ribosome maturation factor RimM [Gemmatimonadetes bacterium]|nr:ribosome maturation factor RimM [Gemmatimonadota bacterium]